MPDTRAPYLTIGQCAPLKRTKVYELLAEGAITGKKLGTRTFISRDSLDRYLDNLPPYLATGAK
jgi:excisionase family DNA binding protein